MEKEMSVRQWQKRFRAGAFAAKDFATQCAAGWYDWFCRDDALAGRLKKLSKVVMNITEPFILDNYYVWFKNNCPMNGPLYDDARFDPLDGERNGNYFLVTLDCPHETEKWVLYTERYGFSAPEFGCANVRDMVKYVNGLGRELGLDVQPPFVAEKNALESYIAQNTGIRNVPIFRDGEHQYKYRMPRDTVLKTAVVVSSLADFPAGVSVEQTVQVGEFSICASDISGAGTPQLPQKSAQAKQRGHAR